MLLVAALGWLGCSRRGAIIRRQERDAPRAEILQGEAWEFETLGLRSGWRKRRRRRVRALLGARRKMGRATFRRCITRARARSRKRWSTWRGAKRSSRSWGAAKSRLAGRSFPPTFIPTPSIRLASP